MKKYIYEAGQWIVIVFGFILAVLDNNVIISTVAGIVFLLWFGKWAVTKIKFVRSKS